MSVDFVDTNVIIYAHDRSTGRKHEKAVDLLTRLFAERARAISIQVLIEFHSAATKKLKFTSAEADEVSADMAAWAIHRPGHDDLIRAAHLHRRYNISWWDALILNSASELGCNVLWTEDLSHGQRYGAVTVQNPFL
jgi:predicted nucleic acid-binding protein